METAEMKRCIMKKTNPRILIKNTSRVFQTTHGPIEAIKNINLSIRDGEFFSIVGPSGCGKTTLLRILAGLEKATSGSIVVNSSDQNRPLTSVVFQEQSIFPWMNNQRKQNKGTVLLSWSSYNKLDNF